jgi:hypothetical protein
MRNPSGGMLNMIAAVPLRVDSRRRAGNLQRLREAGVVTAGGEEAPGHHTWLR